LQNDNSITVTQISPHVGAEIGNVDLTGVLTSQQVDGIHEAIIAHGVVFFRNQNISPADHERFIRYFGEPHVHVGGKNTASQAVPGHPALNKQAFDKNSPRVSGETWHSDQSCAAVPPMYSVLYQEVIPPHGGGDTMFLSAAKAYEELSPGMKVYLEGKTATHTASNAFDKKNNDPDLTVTHPMVVRHPENGRAVLFVNPNFTSHINDVPADESRHLLEFLYQHMQRPHWTLRFHWTPHSIAMWDNRAVQHQAIWDYWPNERVGYRMFVGGIERPVAA
jgi:taurine dioxygenase